MKQSEELPRFLWGAGIDYFRGSVPCENQEEAERLYNGTEFLLLQDRAALWANRAEGTKEPIQKAWRWMGYEGWTDGLYSLGRRENRIMVQISGFRAQWGVQALRNRFKPSRLDLQITVWYDYDNSALPKALYEEYKQRRSKNRNLPQPKYISNGDAGDTLYLSKRGGQHAQMLRIYDKWLESLDDEYKWALRYEWELYGKHANAALESMVAANYSPDMAAKIVMQKMHQKKIFPPLGQMSADVWRQVPQKPEKRLAEPLLWINRQVAPAIRKMLDTGMSEASIVAALTTDFGGEIADRPELQELREEILKRYSKG